MKVLIGTPINEIKDYCMERWLHNVAKLQKEYTADLLLVDNSDGTAYMTRVQGYCKAQGVKNYKIEHIEISPHQPPSEKIGRSREIIRQHVLKGDYEAWFSWESDQIIPTFTLTKLVEILKAGNYQMVHPNAWTNSLQNEPAADFGVCLIKRESLEKFGFLLEYPNMRDCWHGGEAWFKKQVLKSGGSYIEIYGIINPIYHLNK